MNEKTRLINNDSTHQKPLSAKQKFFVSLGIVPIAATEAVRGYFSTPFFLDVVGLSGFDFGNIQLISRLWDAFTDPMMGYVSDRYVTRFGRRRPWLVLGVIPFAIFYMAIWSTFISTSAYAYLLLFMAFETFATMINVPYQSLMSEMATSYDESTSLSSYRFFTAYIANTFAVASHNIFITQFPDSEEEDAYFYSAVVWASIAIPCVLLAVSFAREKSDLRIEAEKSESSSSSSINGSTSSSSSSSSATPTVTSATNVQNMKDTEEFAVKESFWANLKHVAAVKNYWMACSLYLSVQLAAGFYTASLILYLEHVLDLEGSSVTLLLILQNLARAAGVPVALRISYKYGKKATMCWGMVIYALLTLAVFPIDKNSVWAFYLLVMLKGSVGQAVAMVPFSCIADVVDSDELFSGTRRDGTFMALWSFLGKVVGSISIAFSAYILAWSGYESEDSTSASESTSSSSSQSDTVLLTLVLMQSVIPFLFLTVGLYFGWKYDLDKSAHETILRQLNARRNSGMNLTF